MIYVEYVWMTVRSFFLSGRGIIAEDAVSLSLSLSLMGKTIARV